MTNRVIRPPETDRLGGITSPQLTGISMWNTFVCRHYDVQWIDSHTCNCQRCGKFGHYFEDGFALWTKAERRPQERIELDFLLEKKAG